jgi:hypothetical protein
MLLLLLQMKGYPLAQQVRVDAMFERHARHRHPWLEACLDQLGLRLFVIPPAPIPLAADDQALQKL